MNPDICNCCQQSEGPELLNTEFGILCVDCFDHHHGDDDEQFDNPKEYEFADEAINPDEGFDPYQNCYTDDC